MTRIIQLRRFFSVLLLTAVLLVGTAIGGINTQALAATGAKNDVSNVKGSSKDINGSYHKLQEAAHDFRNKVRQEQKPFFNDKASRASAQAKTVKNVFQRTADSLKQGLSSD